MTVHRGPCEEFLAHLEHYFDSDTDRTAADRHLAECASCRSRFEELQERLRDLPCQEFVELVTDYLEEVLPPELRSRADQHLRLCEGCRTYLDQMRRTVGLLAGLAANGGPSPEVRAALLAVYRSWRQGR